MKYTRYYIYVVISIIMSIPQLCPDYTDTLCEDDLVSVPLELFTHINVCNTFAQKKPGNSEVWCTIFIHGTFIVKPQFLLGNLVPLLHDTIEDTMYAKTVLTARQHPVFYQNQAMQEQGLKKINPTLISSGYASGAVAQLFEAIETETIIGPKNENYYYTFGWSGLVSQSIRHEESKILYQELCEEINQWRSAGIEPKIRLIGYSHGGSIALNIASFSNNNNLVVDELILLGTPIEKETDYLIQDPLFKKVYNLFSRADFVQPRDFFSAAHASSQEFKPRDGFLLPSKLTQIEIRVSSASIYAPDPCSDNVPLRYQRKRDPGHIELWFFGWTPRYYRKTFPLYPIPVVAFLPAVISAVDRYTDNRPYSHSFIADIHPQCASIIVTDNCLRSPEYFPFISQNTYYELVAFLNKYKPYNYKARYKEQKYYAYKKALAFHRAYKQKL